jgi:hypothetical protein
MIHAGSNRNIWNLYRRLYYGLLVSLVMVVGLYFGPHLLLFHRLSGISVDDFVPEIDSHGVPIVKAIKRYQAANGYLPKKIEDLVPDYLAQKSIEDLQAGEHSVGSDYVSSGGISPEYIRSTHLFGFFHQVEYNLDGQDEHWEVRGAIVRGRIPLPPVTIESATQTNPRAR